MDNRISFRLHPLNIFKFFRKLLFILLLPLLRSILNYGLQGTLSTLVRWETALAVALLAYGMLRWARFLIWVEGDTLFIRSGIFFRKEAQLSISTVTCVYVENDPLLTLVGAAKVSLDTNAGEFKNSDFEFYLSRKRTGELCDALKTVTPRNRIYLCNLRQIALMSLSSASALSGLLVAASIINNSGKLLGDTLEKRLVETLNLVTELFSRIIPPAATTLAALLVAGSCVSFIVTLVKHISFVVHCNKKGVLIEQGLFRHKRSYIRREAIGVGIISMPPLLHLFRRTSLCIHASGYGTSNGERSILFPVEKAREAEKSMHMLGIDLCKGDSLSLRVPRRAMSRAVFLPILLLLLLIAVTAFAVWLMPNLNQIILLFAVFVGVICIYWLYMRVSHVRLGGAQLRNGLRIFGYRGLTLADSRFKKGCVDSIIVSEGPFDRRRGLCSLQATLRGEKAYRAKTVNLDKIEVEREINSIFNV